MSSHKLPPLLASVFITKKFTKYLALIKCLQKFSGTRYHTQLGYFLCFVIAAPPAVTSTVPGNLVIDSVERDECVNNGYENPTSAAYMQVTGAVSRTVRLASVFTVRLGQANVFTSVCDSVNRGISVPTCITGHMTRGSLFKGVSIQDGVSVQWGVSLSESG